MTQISERPEVYYSTITHVSDHGTIQGVHLKNGTTVYFDHRPWRWLVESRGGLENVIGARARRVDTGECEDEANL